MGLAMNPRLRDVMNGAFLPRVSVGAASILALSIILPADAHANTILFNNTGTVCTITNPCWRPGTFGALVGLIDTSTGVAQTGTLSVTSNGDSITGAIGFGAGSVINTTKTESWSGPIDFSDPLSSTSGHCPGGVACPVPTGNTMTNVTLSGSGTVLNSNRVSTAITQMEQMSDFWSGVAATHWTGTLTPVTNLGRNGGTTSLGTVGAGIQVFSTNSISTNTGLTISGNASDLIIVNVTTSASFSRAITLTGGITADQVLFNVLGTGNNALNISANAATILTADFFVRNSNYSLASATIHGRVLGGNGTDSWGGSLTLVAPADVPEPPSPEPGTWAMMIGGFAAMVWWRYRKARA
jgi:hypothetical protein